MYTKVYIAPLFVLIYRDKNIFENSNLFEEGTDNLLLSDFQKKRQTKDIKKKKTKKKRKK